MLNASTGQRLRLNTVARVALIIWSVRQYVDIATRPRVTDMNIDYAVLDGGQAVVLQLINPTVNKTSSLRNVKRDVLFWREVSSRAFRYYFYRGDNPHNINLTGEARRWLR